jgi:Flp pilus assembly CpaF family ATPase
MHQFDSTHEVTPYYYILIKEYLLNLVKNAHNLEDLPINQPINFLKEQGYDVCEREEEQLLLWLDHLLNFNFLKEIFENEVACEKIEEIILHGPQWVQVIGQDRKEFFTSKLSLEDYQFSLELFALKKGVLWNQSSPFKCFKAMVLGRSWRVTLSHQSLSSDGISKLFLRSQADNKFTLSSFGITSGQEELIRECLTHKKNILVCGATGSGKTTFLKSLIDMLPKREHIITLEDTSELNPASAFATQLLAQNQEGHQLKDYCHYALRMRPDRLIIGEVRSAEVVPFLLSINTGHGGMMASLHANSGLDALHRMTLLFQIYCGQMNISYHDVLKLVCQGVDFVFFLNHKRIESIIEVKGCEGMTPFYEMWN